MNRAKYFPLSVLPIVLGVTAQTLPAIAQSASQAPAQTLEVNGTPGLLLSSLPSPTPIRQERTAEIQQVQRTFPTLRDNWQEQEKQLQQEAAGSENISSSDSAAGNAIPDQDTPDQLEIPL